MPNRPSHPPSVQLRYAGYGLLTSLLLIIGVLAIGVFSTLISLEAINSISTILLVMITGIYAFLTWMLVVENRRARREQYAPSFVVNPDIFGPRIRNIGNGPARNLEIELTLLSDDHQVQTVIRRDGLTPGNEVWVSESPFAAVGDESADVHTQYEALEIKLSFKDIFGRSGSRTLTYDTETLVEDETLKSPEQQIANNLQKINTTLERMLDSLHKMQEQDRE